MPSVDLTHVEELLTNNERAVSVYYRLAAALLIGALLTHLAFASYYVYSAAAVHTAQVLLFAVFNVTALIVEIYLSRIAFMLASRGGQLRDMRYALAIAVSQVDARRFGDAAKAIMSMRRDAAALKIVDIEAITAKLSQAKGAKGGDAS
jgi:hypothetical protein